jgi:4-oxalocrotonate tautomerase
MPLINVKLIEDVFTPDQKREIVERLTDAMVSIEGENMRSVTWVVVEEVASGDWGIGGQPPEHQRRQSTRRWRARLAPPADHGRGGRRGDRSAE